MRGFPNMEIYVHLLQNCNDPRVNDRIFYPDHKNEIKNIKTIMLTEHQWPKWFAKFRSGISDLKNAPGFGRSVKVKDDEVQAFIDVNCPIITRDRWGVIITSIHLSTWIIHDDVKGHSKKSVFHLKKKKKTILLSE